MNVLTDFWNPLIISTASWQPNGNLIVEMSTNQPADKNGVSLWTSFSFDLSHQSAPSEEPSKEHIMRIPQTFEVKTIC